MNFQINKNNQKKIVSVIICFFNAKKFLKEAIKSVFAQTYKHWELLLIDDGSTDRSTKIARQYAERYPQKVSYIEHAKHRNLGTSVSRNVGINKSNGEYIAFLDSDDVWLPQKLEEQIQIMTSHPKVAMVYGPALQWYNWSDEPVKGKSDFLQELGVKANIVIESPNLLKEFLKNENIVPSPSGVLVRRKIICREGGFEEKFPTLFDDQVLYVKICFVSAVFVAGKCWIKYRNHPDSLCYTARNGKWEYWNQRYWEWVTKYLKEKGITDTDIQTILKKKLINAIFKNEKTKNRYCN
jgi:glycosyltransferase involved in cell wall biosynthesis